MEKIDVSDLPRGELLAELYNRSRPQGMGFLQADSATMTAEDASELIGNDEQPYFDYLKGRVMKIEINGETLDPRLYDRDLGQGAAQAAVDAVRERLGL